MITGTCQLFQVYNKKDIFSKGINILDTGYIQINSVQ